MNAENSLAKTFADNVAC